MSKSKAAAAGENSAASQGSSSADAPVEEVSPASDTGSVGPASASKGSQQRKSKRGSKKAQKKRSTPLSKKTLSIVTNLDHQAKMLPKARGTESEDEAEAELEEQERLAQEAQSLLNAQQWVESQETNPSVTAGSLARSINRSGRGPVVKILMLGDSGIHRAKSYLI
jgi:hypothetical protein